MRRILFLFSAFMLLSTQVFASGFAVKDQGTKAMGMANAFTAVADDASAAWYNPAALAFQDDSSLTVGGQYVIPTVEYTSPAGVLSTMDKKNHLIPFAYISYNHDDLPVTLGLAVNAPFGLSTDWTNSGAPFDPLTGGITFSEIQMINLNPVVSYKLNDRLSIAAGIMYYKLNKVAFDSTILTQHGNGDGWGGNAALFYRGDAFDVGVTYRSRVKVDVKGTATGIGAFAPFGSTSVTTSITLPDMASVGVAFHPADDWLVSAQYDWVNWKTFDQLNFTRAAAIGPIGTSTIVAENWKASNSFSVGAEWAYNEKMRARFGYAYEQTPVNDANFSPRIADNNRHFFTVGYGYSMNEDTVIDLAYGYIKVSDRSQTASPLATARNGTYKSYLHVVSASLSYHF